MTYPVQPPEPPAIVYHQPSPTATELVVAWGDNSETNSSETAIEVFTVESEGSAEVVPEPTPPAEIVPETSQIADEPLTPEKSLPTSELDLAAETVPDTALPLAETSIAPSEADSPDFIAVEKSLLETPEEIDPPAFVQPSLPQLEPAPYIPEIEAKPMVSEALPPSEFGTEIDGDPEIHPQKNDLSVEETPENSETEMPSIDPSAKEPPTPNSDIPNISTLPQFSRDSRLLNAQTPATPAFDWAVMPSAPNADASFRLPIAPVPPPVDGVALQPSPLVNPPVEVTADLQQFDIDREMFTAEGNVVLRYQGTVIDADWLQVNLRSRQGIGEGNIALTQTNRVLRGDRFRYNFAQDSGTAYGVRGDVNIANTPTPGQTLPSDVSAGGQPRLLSDRLLAAQPVEVLPGGTGFVGTVGAGRGNNPSGATGTLSRLRFEADEVNFYPRGWQGTGVRITNDPFGPELELRADSATLTRLSPLQDELVLDNPRLVFDDGFALPLLRRRYRIDRRERDPALIQFGFDRRDRGGFYIFRDFEVLSRQGFRLTLTPQYYIQRGFDRRDLLSLREFGLITKVEADFTPSTSLTAIASLTNLDPETFDPDGNPFDDDDGDLRASVRLAQNIPTRLGIHTLTGEYSYRDRLFNGSLGFRTVHQTAGLIFTSPNIPLGTSGFNLSYQASANWVEADTDRLDLLDPIRDSNRVNMGRFQASAALNKGIFLWRGEPLPATPTEGLRFSPVPVVPFVQIFFGVRGIGSFYTRSDPELGLTGAVGIQGQFGHFSKKFFDYSAFRISYLGTLRDGESPFLFDRIADRSILGLSFTQQIYGPLRVGIDTAINLEEGEAFSTDYTLEYSRRSYGLILRFNPQRELGSFTLRISDFNWQGSPEPFTPVDGGVRRD